MPPPRKKPTSRDAKTTDAPGPAPDLQGWLVRFWKPLTAAIIGLLGIAWVAHMEKVARHQRIERQLLNDPRTAPWFEEQRRLIGLAASGDPGAPAAGGVAPPLALWTGTISRLVTGRPRPDLDAEELVALELTGADLLAGEPGEKDGKSVYIGVRGFPFPGGAPAAGERWMISVSRNADSHNLVYSAIRDLAPR